MSKGFVEHKHLNLTEVNHEVLKLWDEEDLFHHSISEREGCPSFVFFEGPPSANGHPGIHHVLARSIKDTFCRSYGGMNVLYHKRSYLSMGQTPYIVAIFAFLVK